MVKLDGFTVALEEFQSLAFSKILQMSDVSEISTSQHDCYIKKQSKRVNSSVVRRQRVQAYEQKKGFIYTNEALRAPRIEDNGSYWLKSTA